MEAPDSIDSYVLCIANGGYPEPLEVRKVYAVLPDELNALVLPSFSQNTLAIQQTGATTNR